MHGSLWASLLNNMRTKIFITFTVLCSLTTLAQDKLANINDADGFTNIRSGEGKEFEIVGTISKDDFFLCSWTDSEWIRISGFRRQEGDQLKGYVHKSRVRLIDELDSKSQLGILTSVLTKQKELADNFQKVFKSKDDAAYKRRRTELELHSDSKYSPTLNFLSKYFCSKKDKGLLTLFYATIWSDKGSANELPSFAIAQCFICNSDIVTEELNKIRDKEELKLLTDDIEWGLLNHFNVDENGKSDNKEFNKLKFRLESVRKKASP